MFLGLRLVKIMNAGYHLREQEQETGSFCVALINLYGKVIRLLA